jgi:hypothetical protein
MIFFYLPKKTMVTLRVSSATTSTNVAIGQQAGQLSQGSLGVAIGAQAGSSNQGANAVAIGAFAGRTNQASGSIVINASGANVNTTTSGLFVRPLRNVVTESTPLVVYDPSTYELSTGSSNISVPGTITAAAFGNSGTTYNAQVGMASAPSYAFASDPTTGVYRYASGQLGFSAGGVGIAQVTSQGLVVRGHQIGLGANVDTQTNLAVGASALASVTTGIQNTAIGVSAMSVNTTGSFNTAVGLQAMMSNTTGSQNTAVGRTSMTQNTSGGENTAVGFGAMRSNTTGTRNTAIGQGAMQENTTGSSNTAIGRTALYSNTTGSQNTAVGLQAMFSNTTGNGNTATGQGAMNSNTTGSLNTAMGNGAMAFNTTGSQNTAMGHAAMYSNTTGSINTAIGQYAMLSTNFVGCSALGYNATVTGDNQVQLGGAGTTTYVYGTVQNRSDARDKAEIRDSLLGLDFIRKLRPVDFKWNLREDYVSLKWTLDNLGCSTDIDAPVDIYVDSTHIGTYDPTEKRIILHQNLEPFESPETTTFTCPTHPDLQFTPTWTPIEIERPNDFSKMRTRYHHGFVAQDVKNVTDELGVDFGGYQDHSVNGGKDVLSLGYDELIAPLVNAVQELHRRLTEIEMRSQST